MAEFFALILYFTLLFVYATSKGGKASCQSEFAIGDRSLNRWTVAMAAHASDMSNWLFMAYPGMIFLIGGTHIWASFGLILMMGLNWTLVAGRLRKQTEKLGSITITGFFESKVGGGWPQGRLITSLFVFFFYMVYVAVMLSAIGLLLHSLFPISYLWGLILGTALILPLLLAGGYLTLAKMDLFQGIFLLLVLIFVPLYIIFDLGGASPVIEKVQTSGRFFSPFAGGGWAQKLSLLFGWGLGYFGQPHILTKFMGIKDPAQIRTSRNIGMIWQILSLGFATVVGFVGIAAFGSMADPEQVFILLVRSYFPPFLSGIFLCAIIAAVINAVSSMLLVLSTTVTEDVYKRFFVPNATETQALLVSRLATIALALGASFIGALRISSMDKMVLYAWSGLGATFGPLVIASLYVERLSRKGAWISIAIGGGTVALWPILSPLLHLQVEPLVVAFPLSLCTALLTSRKKRASSEPILG